MYFTFGLGQFVNFLGGKGHFSHDIPLVDRETVEGIVFCGNVHAVKGFDLRAIVFDVQAVVLLRAAVNSVIPTPVKSGQHQTVFLIVAKFAFTLRHIKERIANLEKEL